MLGTALLAIFAKEYIEPELCILLCWYQCCFILSEREAKV